MKLHGQTIILTGSSSGIGEQAAYQLSGLGARLCLVARRTEELERVAEAIRAKGGEAWVYPCDLSEPASVNACAEAILQAHPRIDALVNNAAHSIRRSIQDSLDRPHDFERTIQLNYLSAVRLTLRILPRFIEQGSGHVVNITTMSSQFPIPLFSAYIASKMALESFSRSLLAEFAHKGITTTVVYFPLVRTPMSSRTAIYKHERMMTVERAAGWIVEAVEKRPVRVSSPVGVMGEVALAAMPSVVIRAMQPYFRQRDKRLKDRLAKD
ncbi:SDR family NAD(P)-dependent oxidoreductase [Aquirhabdus sp.]|uniref:SDR family NAD(P)-dependent oxidoreductase n=1 Tax=Aquirhabdus sp. TaxID=2824160 RepID=UPI00396CD834